MYANKLHINMKKCSYMHFKPKGPSLIESDSIDRKLPPVKINDYEIKEVTETKFLGITIDNNLSWLPHLTSLAKKLRCCTEPPLVIMSVHILSVFLPFSSNTSLTFFMTVV